jgi:hypothetical protein
MEMSAFTSVADEPIGMVSERMSLRFLGRTRLAYRSFSPQDSVHFF